MKNRTLIIDALAYERNKAFGFQEYLFNLLDYFYINRDSILFNKIILVCDKKEENDFERFSIRFEIKGFQINNILHRYIIQSIFPFSLRLKSTDVILNLSNYSGLFKRSKNILVIHDLLFLRNNLLKNKFMRLQRHLYVPRSIKLADQIIAISNFTKNDIEKNYMISTKIPVVKIHNYFNFNKFDFPKKLENERPYFLSVSSSSFHKNTITILKSFEKFCLLNNDFLLYLVGGISHIETQKYYNHLPEKVKNRIRIFKNLSNKSLGNLYANCFMFISASFFEGLGMPIVEAMYFNVPLVLSDIEVFREITNNKAIFFDSNSDDELTKIMLNQSEKIKTSITYDLANFSALNTSRKYIDIINNI